MRLDCVAAVSLAGLLSVSLTVTGCRDSSTSKQAATGSYNMGEKAQVGPIIYTIIDTKWVLSLGEQPAPRLPVNRFFIINVSAVNSGPAAVSIPTFSLVDDSGQSYQELDNGEGVHDWIGFARRVRPAESIQGTIVFDAPQRHFKLRVSDEEDHFTYVDIPLSLGEAPPDVTPGATPPR